MLFINNVDSTMLNSVVVAKPTKLCTYIGIGSNQKLGGQTDYDQINFIVMQINYVHTKKGKVTYSNLNVTIINGYFI